MPDIFTSHPKPTKSARNAPSARSTASAADWQSDAGEEEKVEEQKQGDPLPPHVTKAKHTLGLFSHYCPNPTGITFANQEKNELIVLFLRKHFITNLPWILMTGLLLILPIFVILIFQVSQFSLFALPPNFFIILISFYYLVVLNYALVNFIIWFYHVGIVTQRRLLDLDVHNILNHHLAETNITEIVGVSYSQQGFAQSFFNYGNIPIQTEAIKANFEFELAPKPSTVSDIITDLRPYAREEEKHAS